MKQTCEEKSTHDKQNKNSLFLA